MVVSKQDRSPASCVLPYGDGLKMIGVDARTAAADMIEDIPVRHLPNALLVKDFMGDTAPTFVADFRVPISGVPTGANPAPRHGIAGDPPR